MRIIQITSVLWTGDGIGLAVLDLDKIIKARNIATHIYADKIDPRFSPELVSPVSRYECKSDDIVILHVGGASRLNEWVKSLSCRKIMLYHNITPPSFFEKYNKKAADYCRLGLEQVASLNKTFDMVLAVSGFNKKDLKAMDYTCKINILPTLVPLDDYTKTPSSAFLKKYDDDFTNIMFLGRIVPNKKHQDVIAAFSEYQKKYNPKSRLFLAGNPNDFEGYDEQLKEYVRLIGTKNVIFTGHTKFDEILACYTLADLFLCMSEHEGFCVPLIEAMVFNVPIVAYASTAIPDTLGKSGFLLKEKNPALTASVMNKILTDSTLQETIIKNQQERLSDFTREKIASMFWEYMKDFIV